jgi:GNAT superfamily N-acetyltransferase
MSAVVTVELHRQQHVLDELEPLWLAMLAHHRSLPDVPPAWDDDASWQLRRQNYVQWLQHPASFVAVARRGDTAVGYAMVVVHDGANDTWVSGARYADVESLSVLPSERGTGIGTQLLDAVDAELDRLDILDLQIGAIHSNADAIRLYLSRGLTPRILLLSRFRGGR